MFAQKDLVHQSGFVDVLMAETLALEQRERFFEERRDARGRRQKIVQTGLVGKPREQG